MVKVRSQIGQSRVMDIPYLQVESGTGAMVPRVG